MVMGRCEGMALIKAIAMALYLKGRALIRIVMEGEWIALIRV